MYGPVRIPLNVQIFLFVHLLLESSFFLSTFFLLITNFLFIYYFLCLCFLLFSSMFVFFSLSSLISLEDQKPCCMNSMVNIQTGSLLQLSHRLNLKSIYLPAVFNVAVTVTCYLLLIPQTLNMCEIRFLKKKKKRKKSLDLQSTSMDCGLCCGLCVLLLWMFISTTTTTLLKGSDLSLDLVQCQVKKWTCVKADFDSKVRNMTVFNTKSCCLGLSSAVLLHEMLQIQCNMNHSLMTHQCPCSVQSWCLYKQTPYLG